MNSGAGDRELMPMTRANLRERVRMRQFGLEEGRKEQRRACGVGGHASSSGAQMTATAASIHTSFAPPNCCHLCLAAAKAMPMRSPRPWVCRVFPSHQS